MTEKEIREAQASVQDSNAQDWDITPANMQLMIDSGVVWKMEGSAGRAAMDALESGVCFLPEEAHTDYYGNRIPSRNDLKEGTKGTLQNSSRFWEEHLALVEDY